jgi:hypothetical protein
MPIDRTSVPHYLVTRNGSAPYVLSAERRLLRRAASSHLFAFARARTRPTPIDGESGTTSLKQKASLPTNVSAHAYTIWFEATRPSTNSCC